MTQIKVSINFIRDSQGLHSQLQSIAGQLATPPTPQKAGELTKRLDRTSSSLKEMKNKAADLFGSSSPNYFEGLEDEIINMYGQIENALITHKVTQIQSLALNLKKLIELGQVNIQAMDSLKRQIQQFLYDYCPSLQDRKTVAEANKIIENAQESLAGKTVDCQRPTRLEWISQQKNTQFIDNTDLESGQYEDLFDIAALIYNNKRRDAKSRYHQLPEELKLLIQAHLKHLTAIAFEDPTETIQALLATANQLIDNGETYPSSKQIDEIFLGLQAITAAEETNPSAVSWII